MRVLMATEHADLRLSIELLLSEEPGITLVGAASETEGLHALINSTDPDIVILDWDLPGRPMPDLLSESHRLNARLKFILLVATLDLKDVALHVGADTTVVKGGPPDLLLAAFRKTREQIRAADESFAKKE